jgi:hypothetical protein
LKALRRIHTYHAIPMLFPCRFKDQFTHTMPFPCRSLAVPLLQPCHSSRVLCFTLATTSEIGVLLIKNFLELGVASRQHVANMPSPCHRDPATNVPWPWEVAFRKAYLWHGRGTACVNQNTAALWKSKDKDTIDRLSRTAW